jgi:DNA-binding NarL/FixJ family response regulator
MRIVRDADHKDPQGKTRDGSDMRLMVVDDSPLDRLLLTRSLSAAFPDARLSVVGSSLSEFQDALEDAECDLVVADYSLGWADGFEVMRSVRQRWPQCRAILFTVMPSDRLFAQAMSAGFDACLAKSSSMEPLTFAVEGALALSGRY